MAMIDGAVIIAKVLKQYGVEQIFGLTGGHVFRIMQECKKLDIHVVDVRHETAAVDAASAYSRSTGKLGVVLLTAGPGVLSGVNGIANAKLSGFPLLIIGGAPPIRTRCTKEMQEIDQLSVLKPITNWAESCAEISRLAEYMNIAIREAVFAPRGPVFLEVPVNLLVNEEIEETEVFYPENAIASPKSAGLQELVEAAADLLTSTENVAMFLGDQIVYQLDHPEIFAELATYLKMPIFCSLGDGGRFLPEDNPIMLGGAPSAGMAEVIISFNTVIDYICNKFGPPNVNPEAKIIMVSDDARQIGFNHGADVGIVGSPDIVAAQLLEAVKRRMPQREESDWLDMLPELASSINEMFEEQTDNDNADPMHPGRAAKELLDFMRNEGTDYNAIFDGGDCNAWLGNLAAMSGGLFTRPNRVICGMYKLGGIGYGAGASTGLYYGTGQPVLYCTGDGSVGQYLGEFFTYAKHNIPVIGVIMNNSSWNMIKTFCEVKYPDEDSDLGCDLETYDGNIFHYEKLAEAFGGYYEYVTDPKEICPALKRAKESGKVAIINIRTEKGIAPEASIQMGKDIYNFKD